MTFPVVNNGALCDGLSVTVGKLFRVHGDTIRAPTKT
jgi:hypothetical protein